MSKLAAIEPHLSLEEIESRYRSSDDVTERSHWQVIWLRAKGMATKAVTKVTSYRDDWVRQLVRRYNEDGPESLGDRRRDNPGRQPMLDAAKQAELYEVLQGPAPDGGLWSGPKVAHWITQETGEKLSKKGGWVYLRKLGMTVQLPRPCHPQANLADQEEFKKNSGVSLLT